MGTTPSAGTGCTVHLGRAHRTEALGLLVAVGLAVWWLLADGWFWAVSGIVVWVSVPVVRLLWTLPRTVTVTDGVLRLEYPARPAVDYRPPQVDSVLAPAQHRLWRPPLRLYTVDGGALAVRLPVVGSDRDRLVRALAAAGFPIRSRRAARGASLT